jgi:formate hydrogenlyase transcriptional activator
VAFQRGKPAESSDAAGRGKGCSNEHEQPPSSTEDALLRAIVEGVEAETGDQFFASLVRHLASALKVQYAFVSELTPDRQSFRTLALWARGAFLENVTVPLAGTPCEAVLNGQMSHYPTDLQSLFPDDKVLVEWNAVSYCGVPLLDCSGVVVGHLAIIDDQPMWDGPRGVSILRIFAARARAEIERLRAESALRQSEAAFRDLYREAPIAYCSVGTDGIIRRWNRKTLELLGYTDEELNGRPVSTLWADTPAGIPRGQRFLDRFRAGHEIHDQEIELRRKDGAPIWVRLFVRPIRDAAGRVQATRSAMVDVTELKHAEEARLASEERLARVLASAMDAIVTFDVERRIEIFNEAAESIFRCPAAEAIGKPLDRFLTDGLRQSLEKATGAFMSGGQTRPYVYAPDGLHAQDANGREFPVEGTISHVEVAGRSLFTLILRDVEERRRAEQETRELHRQNLYLQEEIKSVHNFEEIIGQSRTLADVLKQVDLVAATDSSVLILGETGTGKELIARAIHSRSPRRARPLIKVNCAVLPAGLVESELFGHEQGAFTGATARRIGRFELAHGGTIFLDEVGELPPEVQAKLLRVLQEHEFERVGGSKTIRVDARVIAATNRDLEQGVAAQKFRADLFYRLNVFPVHLPPLRQRPEDIPLLVHYFVGRYAAKIGRTITHVPDEVMQRFGSYAWPGNVRELENVIERAVILSPGRELCIAPEVLSAASAAAAREPELPSAAERISAGATAVPLEEVQRQHILSVLERTGWRIEGAEGAARLLNMNPSTLRSRMQKLGIRRRAEGAS